jgi:hypothetical protein
VPAIAALRTRRRGERCSQADICAGWQDFLTPKNSKADEALMLKINNLRSYPDFLTLSNLEVVGDSSYGSIDTFNSDLLHPVFWRNREPTSYGRFDHESGNKALICEDDLAGMYKLFFSLNDVVKLEKVRCLVWISDCGQELRRS